MDSNSEAYLLSLQSLLIENVSLEEVKIVCLELNVPYEQLWGDDKQEKIWDLLLYLIHEDGLDDLLNSLNNTKPEVSWPPIPDDFDFPFLQEAAIGADALESISKDGSIGGDQISAGDITDSQVAIGEGASVNVNTGDTYITIVSSETAVGEVAAAPLIEEEIRLDVATPTKVIKDETFDVAVSVRQPTSALLSVADLTAVTSGEGAIFRTVTDEVVKYRIEVTGSGFTVEPESYTIQLRPKKDSRIYFFQLTPFGSGKKTIVVNAYQEDETLAAQTRIRLEVLVAVN